MSQLSHWRSILIGIGCELTAAAALHIWPAVAYLLFPTGLLLIVASLWPLLFSQLQITFRGWSLFEVVQWLAISLALFFLFTTYVVNHRTEKAPPQKTLVDAQKEQPTPIARKPQEKPERIAVDVTPEYLMEFYKGRTAVQADKLMATYIGKWRKLSGPLGNVWAKNFQGTLVSFEPRELWPIVMYFDDDWIQRLEVLTPGTPISAFCQIKDASMVNVRFEHCELLEPK
jgi:hypothetical protein